MSETPQPTRELPPGVNSDPRVYDGSFTYTRDHPGFAATIDFLEQGDELGWQPPLPGISPAIIAIDGETGAGKTSFAVGVWHELGTARVEVVEADDYFIAEAPSEASEWESYDRTAMGSDLNQLRQGKLLEHSTQDWRTGEPGETLRIDPATTEYVIVPGVGLLHPDIRQAFDLVVHLDTPHDLSYARAKARTGNPDSPEWSTWERNDLAIGIRYPAGEYADLIVSTEPTSLQK
ncbi:MAG TPA: hypothetical protein VJP80_04065 [Candidatus Saccharimonadales bacterium]|nr:hypothetical protein [Candidatus Saccharimonadales bacterium]